MVSAASRMLSAISFGVFWRLAPSTIAIIRSRNVSPGSAATLTMIQSERTRVPPMTALRSPPLSRMTGALSPVMAVSLTDATPSTISPSHGTSSSASMRTMSPLRSVADDTVCDGRVAPRLGELLRRRVLARLAQRVGLRLAAALGHRLGEVREEHGEPEPERDREDEAGRRLALADERLDEEDGREDAADLDDEHDRVLELVTRVELLERVDDGALDDRPLEELARPLRLAQRGVRRRRGTSLLGESGAFGGRPAGSSSRRTTRAAESDVS